MPAKQSSTPTPPFNAESEVKSPCVSLCVLNEQQVCLGCGRTRREVGGWSAASADEQRAICRLATARLEAML